MSRGCSFAQREQTKLRTTCYMFALALAVGGCGASARTREQQLATRELPRALGAVVGQQEVALQTVPPLCLRLPARGPNIIAVVLGRQNQSYVTGVMRRLHLKAAIELSSVGAYNASVEQLRRTIGSTVPTHFRSIEVLYSTIPIKRQPAEGIDCEPLCPRVNIAVHAHATPTSEEVTWAHHVVGRYGPDRVSIYYGEVGVAD
jgi:hypothetical protein